jgi:hypothetical protein
MLTHACNTFMRAALLAHSSLRASGYLQPACACLISFLHGHACLLSYIRLRMPMCLRVPEHGQAETQAKPYFCLPKLDNACLDVCLLIPVNECQFACVYS